MVLWCNGMDDDLAALHTVNAKARAGRQEIPFRDDVDAFAVKFAHTAGPQHGQCDTGLADKLLQIVKAGVTCAILCGIPQNEWGFR